MSKQKSTQLLPVVIPEGGFLTFPQQVGIKHFEDAKTACALLTGLQLATGKNSFQIDEIANALGLPASSIVMNQISYSPEQVDLIHSLAVALEQAPDVQTREDLWDLLGYTAKYEVLLPEVDSLNVPLYELLDVEPETIRKAFTQKHKFVKPVSTSGSTHYGFNDETVAGQLAVLLRLMPKIDVPRLAKSFNERHMYLLAVAEVQYFVQNSDEHRLAILCAFRENDLVPPECAMLNAIQELAPEVFERLKENFLNPEFPECRELFHSSHGNSYADAFYVYHKHSDDPHDTMEDLIDSIENAFKLKEE